MELQRKDAARNRTRILDVAREAASRGEDLTLNAIARAAEIGVGTVYRHFASVEALEEALVWERFDELGELLRAASPDGIEQVLRVHFGLLVGDPLFERVTSRTEVAHENTAVLRRDLIESLTDLLRRAKMAGLIRPDLEAEDLLALLCGLAHGVRMLAITSSNPRAQHLFRILLDGLRAER